MEKLIKVHRDNDQLDFKAIWKEGIFVFDSNVLLDLYRLPSSAQKDLLRILKNEGFNKRIWIGFQVLLEFFNNRYEAISDQKNKFNAVRKLIDDAIEQYDETINNLESELAKLKLKQRHSLIDPDKFINESKIKKGIKFLHDFLGNLEGLEKKQSDVTDKDEIKDIVLDIFKDKIGNGFDKKRLQEIYKIGEKRYDSKIPPGYKDSKKDGAYLHEDKEFIRKYGDLILWFEIIEKAISDKLKYVVLVTGDVKEDWWFEKRGRKLGPRLELLNEIYTKAPDLDTFFLYDTASFLKFAQKELDDKIKDSSINEAKQLIELSKENRIEKEEGYIDLAEFLRKCANKFNRLRIGIGKSVKALPYLKIDSNSFLIAIMELFSNISDHSSNGYVGIQAKEESNIINLRFKNLKRQEENTKELDFSRGKGIEVIKSNLAKEMIDCHIYERGNHFIVEMFIPKNTVPNNGYK
tara:strand:+ start:1741 stop:3132 length:1392 start_codon:yes stop_codon:yes gene_type:complete